MTTIELRQASSADAPVVADLMLEAFPDKFDPILGDAAVPVFHALFDDLPVQLTTNTSLALVDGVAVGFIRFGGIASPFIVHAGQVLRACRRHFGFGQALSRYLKLIILEYDPPLPSRELYLKTIGVSTPYRGIGVGTKLVEHAAARARSLGYSAMSLLVMSDNHGAIRLYERLGFHLGPLHRSHILRWALTRDGYHKMTRTL